MAIYTNCVKALKKLCEVTSLLTCSKCKEDKIVFEAKSDFKANGILRRLKENKNNR